MAVRTFKVNDVGGYIEMLQIDTTSKKVRRYMISKATNVVTSSAVMDIDLVTNLAGKVLLIEDNQEGLLCKWLDKAKEVNNWIEVGTSRALRTEIMNEFRNLDKFMCISESESSKQAMQTLVINKLSKVFGVQKSLINQMLGFHRNKQKKTLSKYITRVVKRYRLDRDYEF